MKKWTKIKFKNSDKTINLMAKALTNYLYNDNIVYSKLGDESKIYLETEITNKIAGLLMLYYAHDSNRINDLVNKYNRNSHTIVNPITEGYIES